MADQVLVDGVCHVCGVSVGPTGDVPVSGDFDGDGKLDLTVFRPATGEWHIRYSLSGYGASAVFQWGTAGDVPIVGDFDGDGRADLTVFRPVTGEWFIRYSSTGYSITTYGRYQWGFAGDVPISGDFDGDGRTDLTAYRPATGEWFIRYSSTGYAIGVPLVDISGAAPATCRLAATSTGTARRISRPTGGRPGSGSSATRRPGMRSAVPLVDMSGASSVTSPWQRTSMATGGRS